MNKKQNPEEILSENKTIRFTKSEVRQLNKDAKEAGMSFSDYCRQMALKGSVQAVRNEHDSNQILLFINLLMENKTAFARMSNLIKNRDPHLAFEMQQLIDLIQQKIEMIHL